MAAEYWQLLDELELIAEHGTLTQDEVSRRRNEGTLFRVRRRGRGVDEEGYPAFLAHPLFTPELVRRFSQPLADIGESPYFFLTGCWDTIGNLSPLELLLGEALGVNSANANALRLIAWPFGERLALAEAALKTYIDVRNA